MKIRFDVYANAELLLEKKAHDKTIPKSLPQK